jgi:hypothetical protein
MTTNLGKFNEQMMNFITELRGLFPEDKHLEMLYHAIAFMKRTNPREIMAQFDRYIYPFKKHILERNEDFFLNIPLKDNAIQKIIDENNLGAKNINTENAISKIMNIKHVWTSSNLTDADKDAIWSYFKVFIYLCDKEYHQ